MPIISPTKKQAFPFWIPVYQLFGFSLFYWGYIDVNGIMNNGSANIYRISASISGPVIFLSTFYIYLFTRQRNNKHFKAFLLLTTFLTFICVLLVIMAIAIHDIGSHFMIG